MPAEKALGIMKDEMANHLDGKLLNKRNSFTDFIATAIGTRSTEKLKLRFEYIDVLMALTELAMNSV